MLEKVNGKIQIESRVFLESNSNVEHMWETSKCSAHLEKLFVKRLKVMKHSI